MSDKIYCKAPWVSACHMPGGKFAPCCQWNGKYFNSPEQVLQQVGGAFLRGEVPVECQSACDPNIPPGVPGRHYRTTFDQYQTDFESMTVQFLDFRNNNLCNLKCRSCGPMFSTSWSAEMGSVSHQYDPVDLIDMDLSQCQYIYFAGGEPVLNPQHYELLEHLMQNKIMPHQIKYNTNMTVLGTKNYSVKEFWPYFKRVLVMASIDAVGKNISHVRSGADWDKIEQNLNWMRAQPNVQVCVAPVISALNVWWLQDLFDYFDWLPEQDFSPTLVYSDGPYQLGLIPGPYRFNIIETMKASRFKNNPAIQTAIEELQTIDRSQELWPAFVAKQLLLDKRRNESWFDSLPFKREMFQELAYNTNPWIS